jgi:hypothetical protein
MAKKYDKTHKRIENSYLFSRSLSLMHILLDSTYVAPNTSLILSFPSRFSELRFNPRYRSIISSTCTALLPFPQISSFSPLAQFFPIPVFKLLLFGHPQKIKCFFKKDAVLYNRTEKVCQVEIFKKKRFWFSSVCFLSLEFPGWQPLKGRVTRIYGSDWHPELSLPF